MATISSLRHLCKNVSKVLVSRVNNESAILLVQHSGFANQANLSRSSDPYKTPESSKIFLNHDVRIRKELESSSFSAVGRICFDFFRARVRIIDKEIIRAIVDKTIENLPSLRPEQHDYCYIIKCIRYSSQYNSREDVARLITGLTKNKHVILASSYNSVQTMKLMETYRIFNVDLIDLIMQNISTTLDSCRIKDIQYTMSSLSNFGYGTESVNNYLMPKLDQICDGIVNECRADSYFQTRHLMPILRAFVILGYSNDKFIDYINLNLRRKIKLKAMSQVIEFEKTALLAFVATRLEGGKVALGEGNEEIFRNLSAFLNRRGAIGSIRQDSSINHLNYVLSERFFPTYFPNSKAARDIAELLETKDELSDPAYHFNFEYILPHQNFSSLIISKDFNCPGRFDPETLMPKQVPKGQRHCTILMSRNTDYINGDSSERLSGYKQLIVRLLTKLGYKVIHLNMDKPDIGTVVKEVKLALDGSNNE